MRLYGCGKEEFFRLNDGFPERHHGCKAAGYFSQMRFAEMRQIEWRITFPQWCAAWEVSGKFPQRGRGSASYCMSRIGDRGAYAADNVRIVTNRKNIQDGYDNRRLPGLGVTLKKWRALELRRRGMSYDEIGKDLGAKKQTCSTWACDARRWQREGQTIPPEALV